jgi:hypothetical protein
MGRPSTTGRSLGVSLNSTYIARLARGHGGRCRVIGPVAGCPAPFPSRRNPSHSIRTNPDRLRRPTREDLELGRCSVAEARLQSPSFETLADKVGHRRTGGSPHQHVVVSWLPGEPAHQAAATVVVVVPCTDSADASWIRAVLRRLPEGTRQTQLRSRLALRFPVRRTSWWAHSPRSRAIFEFTGLSTKLSRYPQRHAIHPPFMHSDTHRIGPVAGSSRRLRCGSR